jgi:hypothetical protein
MKNVPHANHKAQQIPDSPSPSHRQPNLSNLCILRQQLCLSSLWQPSSQTGSKKKGTSHHYLTSGLIQRFFRLVKPRPVKFRSFSLSSSVSAEDIRYSISRFNSVSAFSISGTVREQYTNFRLVGKNYGRRIEGENHRAKDARPVGKTQLMTTRRQFSLSQRAFQEHNDPIETLSKSKQEK